MPDENFPSPITPRRFFRSWLASTSRKPSRTTREGLHPNSRTNDVSLFRDFPSSRA
jgi:hypothetical protein